MQIIQFSQRLACLFYNTNNQPFTSHLPISNLYISIDSSTQLIYLISADLPDDPYMSYLFHPRLTFSGTYQADVSTVNNIPSNFDTANFVQSDYLLRGQLWNSRGSGEWNVNASVTQVCYANDQCVSDESGVEPIVGAQFQGMS
jgi:hypothetical protein